MKYIRLGYMLDTDYAMAEFFQEYDASRPTEAVQFVVTQLRNQHVYALLHVDRWG